MYRSSFPIEVPPSCGIIAKEFFAGNKKTEPEGSRKFLSLFLRRLLRLIVLLLLSVLLRLVVLLLLSVLLRLIV